MNKNEKVVDVVVEEIPVNTEAETQQEQPKEKVKFLDKVKRFGAKAAPVAKKVGKFGAILVAGIAIGAGVGKIGHKGDSEELSFDDDPVGGDDYSGGGDADDVAVEE